jgi:hypothetical protein
VPLGCTSVLSFEVCGLNVVRGFRGSRIKRNNLSRAPAWEAPLAPSRPGIRPQVTSGGRLHNILAELAGLYHALSLVEPGNGPHRRARLQGVGLWMMDEEGGWKTRDQTVTAVVAACRGLVKDPSLEVSYQHQRGISRTGPAATTTPSGTDGRTCSQPRALPIAVREAGRVRSCQTGRRSSGRMRPGTR